MDIELKIVEESDWKQYKKDMQEAFQKGYEAYFGKTEKTVLPEKDIERSLNEKGAVAYKAIVDGEMLGGTIVAIDNETGNNHLEVLYVKYGAQTKGIGYSIWKKIEELYPETNEWETCTPYFDRRNVHFYINKCGFHVVEYENEFYHQIDDPDFIGDGGLGMFVFKKNKR